MSLERFNVVGNPDDALRDPLARLHAESTASRPAGARGRPPIARAHAPAMRSSSDLARMQARRGACRPCLAASRADVTATLRCHCDRGRVACSAARRLEAP
jgi:hypothetical protein